MQSTWCVIRMRVNRYIYYKFYIMGTTEHGLTKKVGESFDFLQLPNSYNFIRIIKSIRQNNIISSTPAHIIIHNRIYYIRHVCVCI